MSDHQKSNRFATWHLRRVVGPLVAVVFLSGCVGGTTFGTGVSQEQQLMKDLEGMMTLGGNRKKKINYASRPDLVMPAQSASLPQPLESETSTSNVDWPESPEQKIARIRAQAGKADERSGELPVGELQREKEGLTVVAITDKDVELDRDGHQAIKDMSTGKNRNARALKKELDYSRGANRKYLTEPPNAYRTPEGSAPNNELGISEEQKTRELAKKKELKRQDDTGMWTGG